MKRKLHEGAINWATENYLQWYDAQNDVRSTSRLQFCRWTGALNRQRGEKDGGGWNTCTAGRVSHVGRVALIASCLMMVGWLHLKSMALILSEICVRCTNAIICALTSPQRDYVLHMMTTHHPAPPPWSLSLLFTPPTLFTFIKSTP